MWLYSVDWDEKVITNVKEMVVTYFKTMYRQFPALTEAIHEKPLPGISAAACH
jgi:hypothetical protein